MIGLEPSASVVVRLPRTLAEREGSRASAARRFVRGAGSRRSLAMHLRNCGSRAARSSPTLRRKSASRARTRVFVGEVASGKSLGARYYAPWLGRWTTADPLGLQAGLNLYLYGRASPVVMVDPNGMEDVKVTQEDRTIGEWLGSAIHSVAPGLRIADALGADTEEATRRIAAGVTKQLGDRGEGIFRSTMVAASAATGPLGMISAALAHEEGAAGYGRDALAAGAGVASLPAAIPNLATNIIKGVVGIAEGTNLEGIGYHGAGVGLDTLDLATIIAGLPQGTGQALTADAAQATKALGPVVRDIWKGVVEAANDSTFSVGKLPTKGKPTPTVAPEPNTPIATLGEAGEVTVLDWSTYPAGGPKPSGPLVPLEGADYAAARRLANQTNTMLHKSKPDAYPKGTQIHEVHPVKFGGSPTEEANKLALSPKEHARYTTFWNRVLRAITKGG